MKIRHIFDSLQSLTHEHYLYLSTCMNNVVAIGNMSRYHKESRYLVFICYIVFFLDSISQGTDEGIVETRAKLVRIFHQNSNDCFQDFFENVIQNDFDYSR